MAAAKLPDHCYLRECFLYDQGAGVVTWRTRPVSHFSTEDRRGARWLANRWNSAYSGKSVTTVNPTTGYLQVRIDGRSHHLHRVIWKLMTGVEPERIDHRNRSKTDNAWANLRLATAVQSSGNTSMHRNNRSGMKGVRTDTRSGGFIGRIIINGRDTWLGKFTTAAEAHAAYCAAAREHFGEFWCPG